jgi:hypothetical protein
MKKQTLPNLPRDISALKSRAKMQREVISKESYAERDRE